MPGRSRAPRPSSRPASKGSPAGRSGAARGPGQGGAAARGAARRAPGGGSNAAMVAELRRERGGGGPEAGGTTPGQPDLGGMDPAALQRLLGNSGLGQQDDGPNWWQRNISGPVGEFEQWLLGDTFGSPGAGQDEGEKRGGLRLVWDGKGGEIAAPEGYGDCETVNITDLMATFGAFNKSLKSPQARFLFTKDPKSWLKAAKSWRKILLYVFDKIPSAAGIDVAELVENGMPAHIVTLYEQVVAEWKGESPDEDAATVEEEVLEEEVEVQAPAEEPDKPVVQEAPDKLEEVPGWVMVRTASGTYQAVRDWRLPVKQEFTEVALPGELGSVRVLKETYADGETRIYGRVSGKWVPGRGLGLGDDLPDQEWTTGQERQHHGDGSWESETGWSFLRGRK